MFQMGHPKAFEAATALVSIAPEGLNRVFFCNDGFTGHGGSRAADYVKKNLFKNLLEHPQFVSDTKLAIGMQFSLS